MLSIYQYIKNKFFNKPTEPIVSGFLKKNHIVWECNLLTGEIVEAEIITKTTDNFFIGPTTTREVLMKKNCMYETALNGPNAVRKFEQRIKSSLTKNKAYVN